MKPKQASSENVRENTSIKPVQRRLLVPLAAVLLLLVGGFSLVLVSAYKNNLDQSSKQVLDDASAELAEAVVEQSEGLAALEEVFLRDADLRDALKDRNRERLLAAYGDVFARLRQDHGITHFYFHGPDRVNLLRVHNPEKHGDLIGRFTAREVERTGKTSSGIELGPLGTFTLRVVRPVFDGGTLIGYLELGKEIEDILAGIHGKHGVELALGIRKSALDRAKWEAGMKMLGREADWDHFPDDVLIYTSMPRFPPECEQYVGKAGHTHDDVTAETEFDGKPWRVMTDPIQDVSGAQVGDLIVMNDISKAKAAFNRLIVVTTGAALVLLTALIGFLYVVLRRTDQGIWKQEKGLRKSEAFQRILSEALPDFIFILDANGVIRKVNRVQPGHREEDVVGQSALMFIPRGYHDVFEEAFRQALDTGRLQTVEMVFDLPDGRRYFLNRLNPVSLVGMESSVMLIATDITERKRTEDELRESEARLNEAQRIAQIGSWELDLITNTLHWSDEVYRMLNLDQEKFDATYEGFLENIHPDDREFVNNSYTDSVKNKTPYDVVHRFMLKDGTLKFVNERCETFYDDAGKAVRSIGTVQDITERKQAEEELRKLSEVVKQSPMYIVVTDPEGTIEYVNPAFSEITGYSYDEALGENPRMLKTSETPPSVHKNLWDTILSGNTWKGEFCNKKKDGTKFWESATISPSKNSEGVITHFIAIKEDITERKQAEEALQAEKEFTETALAAQIDTFFVFEPATGKAIRWNKAFKDISGYSDEEIESMKAPDSYYNKEDLEKAEEIIETILQKGQGTVVMSLIDKDGRETPTEYSASIVFDKQGNPKYIISVGRDIKERIKADKEKKMMEGQLRQAQKMEAIGTLAGGIAHDFNNILSAILGHCDLAEMKLAEDSEAIDNLNQMKNAGNRARRLIRQILAFGRMGEQERIALSLTPLIKEALKFLKSTLPTSIEIRDYIEADPGIIEADATQIHQIVMNLCTNAGHAMREEGGTLDVKLTRAEVDAQTVLQHHELHTGPHVRLTVTDTGCGMDSETLEQIFDPYFTTKEVGEGTGLGLSVVHGIVKTHNGVITVQSEPGKGTTFHVYFPVVEKEEKIQEEDEGPLPTGNERILFVDDEEVIVDIGEKTLGQLGYDVVTKTSSVEALELFRADPGRFDLVITDMTMPKMTGDQFARELMMVRPDIAIILCTGFSPKISKEKAKEIGIKAFAMKPLVRRDMANTVRKVLDAGQSEV